VEKVQRAAREEGERQHVEDARRVAEEKRRREVEEAERIKTEEVRKGSYLLLDKRCISLTCMP
jgi:hypothetical protein